MTSPIKPILTCEQFADTLGDLLERDVAESTRAAMEAHALGCADCGSLLADLRSLRIDAANLPELAPSRDLWAGIAERIETPIVAIGAPIAGAQGTARRRSPVWLGLAAAALVGVTATVTYQLTRQSIAAPTAVVASAPIHDTARAAVLTTAPAVDSVGRKTADRAAPPAVATAPRSTTPATASVSLASNKVSAQATYDAEIARLRKIVDGRRGDLDSATVAVLQKNLGIIDEAIKQCRLALRKDPASSYLNDSLNEALDDKVQLLRAAASLRVGM